MLLNPEVLAGAYDYLCACEPFRQWNLPDSDDIKFRATKSRDTFGQYTWNNGKHQIDISGACISHTSSLMWVMAHEIIHLHLQMTGMESRSSDPNVHNAAFRKLAHVVCRLHGFDVKAFW